ncbi:MAG TPA: nitroreductase family protein [Thermomicrobiaceae bacterium]|nr:nitroreductase family protein [Thermomicrobiaceae bacterium]
MGTAETRDVLGAMRRVRQTRQYRPEPVPGDLVRELLEVARWTGSSRNTQPWHFVVVTDREQLRRLSQLRTPINWVAAAPLGIAIVLDGDNPMSEVYDEGRATERLLIAATHLGLRGGVAWFGDADQERQAKEILGVPQERLARSVVAIGYSDTSQDPRPNRVTGGRRPLAEVASYDRFDGRPA